MQLTRVMQKHVKALSALQASAGTGYLANKSHKVLHMEQHEERAELLGQVFVDFPDFLAASVDIFRAQVRSYRIDLPGTLHEIRRNM